MLNVDLFFHHALAGDADIVEVTDGRIFNTARPDKDEQEDRLPYIIITFDGASASGMSKDEMVAELDQATVSILCVASDRKGLADLTDLVHDCIADEMPDTDWSEQTSWAFQIEDASVSASPVQMDESKPCYFQTLTYVCDTNPKKI